MTTHNSAAALTYMGRQLTAQEAVTMFANQDATIRSLRDELATLRATLAQPDALTSQPSGEVVAARLTVYADTTAITARIHDVAHCLAPGTYDLYTHPSADAPGVAVDEWRPIETAPKEAPYWVVWSAYYQRPVVVTQRSNDNTYWEGDWDFDVQATHWTAALAPKPEGDL